MHFTSGVSWEEAFNRLQSIIEGKCLRGSSALIKGDYTCVCFSEAPLALLPGRLVNETAYSHYSPFGLIFWKSWVFEQGGRPVIYGPEGDFSELPRNMQWRHVRYEPAGDPPIDFTWEREWRLQTPFLRFDETSASICVPDTKWANRLVTAYDSEQEYLVRNYATIFDEVEAECYRDQFRWTVLTLRD